MVTSIHQSTAHKLEPSAKLVPFRIVFLNSPFRIRYSGVGLLSCVKVEEGSTEDKKRTDRRRWPQLRPSPTQLGSAVTSVGTAIEATAPLIGVGDDPIMAADPNWGKW
ncbi:hypothetical protein CRG98_011675 [Punica granatum]|uniref:Uncharacterized protein n=1 Tax=Punica granatum TaxID=22663 RepID=A0A2I0KI01_PUNGR|nr:hypothetical protein CRG98_011675 [Punica granatum]